MEQFIVILYTFSDSAFVKIKLLSPQKLFPTPFECFLFIYSIFIINKIINLISGTIYLFLEYSTDCNHLAKSQILSCLFNTIHKILTINKKKDDEDNL